MAEASRLERLTKKHDTAAFKCRSVSFADWLKNSSLDQQGRGTSATHVLLTEEDVVSGYFALTCTSVEDPKAKEGESPSMLSAVLLGKLARHVDFKVANVLLSSAMKTASMLSHLGGAQFLVLDPVNDKVADWYRSHDFKPLCSDQPRLFMKMSKVRKLFPVNAEAMRGAASSPLGSAS